MKDKVKFLIIGIALIVVVILTGTFAWLSYQSNKTAMVLTIGDINNVQVTLQPYQINANIAPTTTYNSSSNNVVNVQAVNNTGNKKRISLYYNINEIDEDLATEDFKYTITRKTTSNGSFSQLKTGDFAYAVAGEPYEILSEKIPENSNYEYKVYLWLDGTQTENTEGASFDGELRADVNIKNNMLYQDSLVYFFDSVRRLNIEKITFLNEIPNNMTNVVQQLDVSLYQNGDVIAYLKDENSNSKYEMYIAADGQIVPYKANNGITSSRLFLGGSNITEINNLHYLDTSEVVDMSSMFESCKNLTSLNLSGLDTSKVTDMSSMFESCKNLTSLNLSGLDTSNVTNMSAMFSGCISITSFNLSNFNTSKVTNMSQMFAFNPALQMIDLSSFDTSSVTDMSGMFQAHTDEVYYETSLTTIYVSTRWTTLAVTSSSDMFLYCDNLPNYDSNVVDKTNAHFRTGGYLTRKPYPAS